MSVRITGLGVGFLAVLALTLAGASNTNNSFGYLLVFTLLGLFVVAAFRGALRLRPLQLARLQAESTFADRRLAVGGALTPIADSMGSLFDLSLSASSQHGAVPGSVARAQAGRDGRFELTLPPQPCGRTRLGDCTISTVYPAGMLRWSLRLDAVLASIWIYPAPIDHLSMAGAGGSRHAAAESGDFDELDAWRDGESLAGVCWKSYARTGKRMRKRFLQASRGTELCFDWDALPTLSDAQKRSQLCFWVVEAHARGDRYGLRLPGIELRPDTGERHYRRCLVALAGSLDA